MKTLKELTQEIIDFREARNWKQFHNPKDLAISLVLEAAEVLEHFQWQSPEEMRDHSIKSKKEIGQELADVFYWTLLLCHDLDIDIAEAFEQKMKINNEHYPVEKAKGKHTKYNKL